MIASPKKPLLANIFFAALLLLYAAVVAEGRFFPTVDGPVHTYNARLLADLLSGDDSSTALFQLNGLPVPYWTSNVLMCLLGIIIGPAEVERAMVLIIVVAMAVAFRWFLQKAGATSPLGAVLIFPFIWTVPLQLGFFNFCVGLALLLFTLGWWLQRSREHWRAKNIITGVLLFLILYFTHLMLFAVGLVLILGYSVWVHARAYDIPGLLAEVRGVCLIAAPALVLCSWYLIGSDGIGPQAAVMPFSQRLEWLLNGQALLTLVWDQEQPMVRVVQTGLLVLSAAGIWHRGKSGWEPTANDAWACAAIVFFAACLVLPDGFSSGTIVLVRLQLIGLMLWAAWCALQPGGGIFRTAGMLIVSGGALWHLHFHWGTVRSLRAEAEDLYSVVAEIGDDATVLPLNYSANWLHGNFPDYLGTWRNTIVLDNFIARYAHAPIRWRQEMEPFHDVGDFDSSTRPCIDLAAWTERTGIRIDHVITLQMPEQPDDSCTISAQRQLADRYSLSFTSSSGHVKLYSLR